MAKPKKTSSKKITTTEKIAIASLVITSIITIFLAFRNEVFQKYLLELSLDTEQASNLAKLEFQNCSEQRVCKNCSLQEVCTESIGIKNTSAATTAKNVRLAIYLYDITESWQPIMSSFNEIGFFVDQTSLSYEIQEENFPTAIRSADGNNAKVFTIDNIPPNETFNVRFYIEDDLTQEIETHGKVSLTIPKKLVPTTDSVRTNTVEYFIDPFTAYLVAKINPALLNVRVSCENCLGGTPYTFHIPTFYKSLYINDPEIEETFENYNTTFEFTFIYRIPLSADSSQEDLYLPEFSNLELIRSETGEIEFIEASK